jgi:hypothetical protein
VTTKSRMQSKDPKIKGNADNSIAEQMKELEAIRQVINRIEEGS